MPVVTHFLPTASWSRLAPTAWAVVSRGGAGDAATLEQIAAGCRGAGGSGQRVSAAGLRGWLASASRRRTELWLAREPGGDAVGAACLSVSLAPHGERWSIPFLLVVPAARRHGVATALVREMLRAAADAGALHVAADTSASWVAASTFWNDVSRRLAKG